MLNDQACGMSRYVHAATGAPAKVRREIQVLRERIQPEEHHDILAKHRHVGEQERGLVGQRDLPGGVDPLGHGRLFDEAGDGTVCAA